MLAFREEFGLLGWTDGSNIRIDYRWSAGDGNRSNPVLFRLDHQAFGFRPGTEIVCGILFLFEAVCRLQFSQDASLRNGPARTLVATYEIRRLINGVDEDVRASGQSQRRVERECSHVSNPSSF
jgi:hypothetical protein